MDLGPSDEQDQLVAAFAALCAREVTPERVRAAEPEGFDPALWSALRALGAPGMGAPGSAGGGDATLLDLALVAEVLGGALAPVPFVDHVVATRVLASPLVAAATTDRDLAALVEGVEVGAFAPIEAMRGVARAVPAGGVATTVVALDGDDLVAVRQDPPGALVPNLGATPVAHVDLRRDGRRVLAEAREARAAWDRSVDEWRVLTAAALVGAGAAALAIGVEYAKSRHQFGVPIGSFQSIARDLADAATALDGARLLVREAAWAGDEEPARSRALAAMAFVHGAESATRAAAVSLHTHGGYGFMLEYDVQLHYRRTKAWALLGGDPRRVVADVADALLGPVGRR